MQINLKNIFIFLALSSALALTAAYFSQYFLHASPCHLCLYQRWPFFLIILVSFIAFYFKNYRSKLFFLCLFLLTLNSLIALYHVGVEKKIFKISQGCVSTISNNYNSVAELKAAIANAAATRCDEPNLFFLGFSMAQLNIIYCISLIIISMFLYKKASKS